MNRTGWVLLAAAAAVMLACGGGGKKAGPPPAPRQQEKKEGARKPLPREEFRKAVLGKTRAEVLEMLGKPERTAEILGQEVWDYRGVSRDPVAETIDRKAALWFDAAGRVERVTF